MYRIIRFYRNGHKQRVMRKGLTLKEAQAHCSREDTHKKDSQGNVIWFDGYTESR